MTIPNVPRFNVPETFGRALSYEGQIHAILGWYDENADAINDVMPQINDAVEKIGTIDEKIDAADAATTAANTATAAANTATAAANTATDNANDAADTAIASAIRAEQAVGASQSDSVAAQKLIFPGTADIDDFFTAASSTQTGYSVNADASINLYGTFASATTITVPLTGWVGLNNTMRAKLVFDGTGPSGATAVITGSNSAGGAIAQWQSDPIGFDYVSLDPNEDYEWANWSITYTLPAGTYSGVMRLSCKISPELYTNYMLQDYTNQMHQNNYEYGISFRNDWITHPSGTYTSNGLTARYAPTDEENRGVPVIWVTGTMTDTSTDTVFDFIPENVTLLGGTRYGILNHTYSSGLYVKVIGRYTDGLVTTDDELTGWVGPENVVWFEVPDQDYTEFGFSIMRSAAAGEISEYTSPLIEIVKSNVELEEMINDVQADGAVTTPKIADGAVIDAKLAQSGGVLEKVDDLKSAFDATVIPWNAIESNTIAEKTYDNSGTIGTNTTFYTVMNIPVTPGQVWYAYSVYSHTSSAYNHKVRKVNFYNGTSYVSMLEYVNQWIIPENITSMNVSMAYIGNSFDNGRSVDDYITIYDEGNRYNHLSDGIRLVDANVPDGFITDRMLQNKYGESWNVILTGTILENTFIRTNGQVFTSNSFYTINEIEVTPGQVWYAFCAYNNSARFVTFYNSSNSAIGGYEYIKSWTIPENAVKMSVTLNYTDGVKSSRDYITSQLFEIIQEIQTEDKKYGDRETRICTINFQFDDGDTKDADIFNIFNNNGVSCGFALISNISSNRVPEYLMYQRNGFEILSHSTDTAGMSASGLDQSTIDTKLKDSKKTLMGYGFRVRGWVTPYSEMHESYIPLLRRYYDFGTTEYFGEYDGTGTPYMTSSDDTAKIFRVSLQSTTLANQKAAVDVAVTNSGFLTFYGHSADLDTTDNETTANLNSLLSYINAKASDLLCVVLKPSDAVDYYFHVRHNDMITNP